MTAFDDDVYGRICSQRITIKTARAENRAIGANPDLVVERRERQHLYIIDDTLDPLDFSHAMLSVAARAGLHDLPIKRNGISVNLVSQIIEHPIIRQSDKFVANFLRNLLLAYSRFIRCSRRGNRSNSSNRNDCYNPNYWILYCFHFSFPLVLLTILLLFHS